MDRTQPHIHYCIRLIGSSMCSKYNVAIWLYYLECGQLLSATYSIFIKSATNSVIKLNLRVKNISIISVLISLLNWLCT